MPKITVIIPNYNHAKYLKQRIDSVLKQTYKDFEIILLDDASTDNSLEIIKLYDNIPNIKILLNKENSGSPFKQWNKGVRYSSGEYLWIAESDDFADEDFLENMVLIMDTNPNVGIAACKSFKIDSEGNVIAAWDDWVSTGKSGKWDEPFIANGKKECLNFIREGNFLPNASALLLRKSIFIESGYADESMRRAGDMMMYAKMLLISDFAFISKSLNYYRSHSGSVRSKSNKVGIRFEEISKVLFYLIDNIELDIAEKKLALKKISTMWAEDVFRKDGGRISLDSSKKILAYGSNYDPYFVFKAINSFSQRPIIKLGNFCRRRWLNKSIINTSIKKITKSDGFYWFGYYDKLQFDPTNRYVLSMKSKFENRKPNQNDIIEIGIIDTNNECNWIPIGTSSAWCWQQGCMLQWVPGKEDLIIWNDRNEDKFISKIYNFKNKKTQIVSSPIYTLHPNGNNGLTLNFSRIHDMRPGYGYAGLHDPNSTINAPDSCGIFSYQIDIDVKKLIIPLSEITKIVGNITKFTKTAKHWFNHLLFNPDGSRFVFLHRWKEPGMATFGTRLITANPDGTNIKILDDYNKVSHFCWMDSKNILSWAWRPEHGYGFYLYNDDTGNTKIIGKNIMNRNGHCTFLKNTDWILNDTYPDDLRIQTVYLYNLKSGKRYDLGNFFSPLKYEGEFRCDAHPRLSPDMTKVVIDGTYQGKGRQQYLIEISDIINK